MSPLIKSTLERRYWFTLCDATKLLLDLRLIILMHQRQKRLTLQLTTADLQQRLRGRIGIDEPAGTDYPNALNEGVDQRLETLFGSPDGLFDFVARTRIGNDCSPI